MDNNQRIELIKWMIDNKASLRTNNISRSSVLLTAGALNIASYAIVFKQISCVTSKHEIYYYIIIPMLTGLIISIISILFAIRSSIHLFNRDRSKVILGNDSSKRNYLHGKSTVQNFGSLCELEAGFRSEDEDSLVSCLLAEYWSILLIHNRSYEFLRKSALLLLSALLILFYQLLVLTINYSLSLK
jgi:hypothetical protein